MNSFRFWAQEQGRPFSPMERALDTISRLGWALQFAIVLSACSGSVVSDLRKHPTACDEKAPQVATTEGPICGIVQSGDGVEAFAYLGIPFAAPPQDDLRWVNPKAAIKRKELYRATGVAPLCPQPGAASDEFIGEEDCLYRYRSCG